jgi:hypothetical protein
MVVLLAGRVELSLVFEQPGHADIGSDRRRVVIEQEPFFNRVAVFIAADNSDETGKIGVK